MSQLWLVFKPVQREKLVFLPTNNYSVVWIPESNHFAVSPLVHPDDNYGYYTEEITVLGITEVNKLFCGSD